VVKTIPGRPPAGGAPGGGGATADGPASGGGPAGGGADADGTAPVGASAGGVPVGGGAAADVPVVGGASAGGAPAEGAAAGGDAEVDGPAAGGAPTGGGVACAEAGGGGCDGVVCAAADCAASTTSAIVLTAKCNDFIPLPLCTKKPPHTRRLNDSRLWWFSGSRCGFGSVNCCMPRGSSRRLPQFGDDRESILPTMSLGEPRNPIVISDHRTGEFNRCGNQKAIRGVAVSKMMKLVAAGAGR
jgi:hypothetical protein